MLPSIEAIELGFTDIVSQGLFTSLTKLIEFYLLPLAGYAATELLRV